MDDTIGQAGMITAECVVEASVLGRDAATSAQMRANPGRGDGARIGFASAATGGGGQEPLMTSLWRERPIGPRTIKVLRYPRRP